MNQPQSKQIVKTSSKIAVIGDTLEARLNHLADLACKLSDDGKEHEQQAKTHYITSMDRYRQCGEVLLTAQAEIEAAKADWRKLSRRQKEKPENKHLKPCTTFVEYIRQKVTFERDTAYFYIAIAEGWAEYKLHECKTLTEALERLEKIKERSNEVKVQIQVDEKYQEELDLLSGQPETVEVIKQVETVKEVIKPDTTTAKKLSETEKQLETQRKENEALRKQLEAARKEKDSLLKQPPASKPVQTTVIPSDYEELKRKAEELKRKAEELHSMPSQFAELQRQLAQVKKEKESLLMKVQTVTPDSKLLEDANKWREYWKQRPLCTWNYRGGFLLDKIARLCCRYVPCLPATTTGINN